MSCCCFFFFKRKTAYEMRISDWSSDVCSSDLDVGGVDTAQVAASQGGAKIELTERAASRMAFGAVPQRIGQVAPPHPLGRIARGGIGQGILEEQKIPAAHQRAHGIREREDRKSVV